MRKGFTKIPNYITDFSLPMEVVGLYTWLSVQADKDGRVAMSLNEISRATGLSKMQVRRYLEKLRVTQLATQLATQPATQLPSITTICFLSSYKAEEKRADTATDTACDTATDTPRAYKNDNIYIMSYKTKEDKIISPDVEIITHTKSACEAFHEWLKKECPYIATHYKLLSETEFEKLKTEYGSEAIAEQCSNIENRIDLRKKYSNLYRTLLNWLKRKSYATTQTSQQPNRSDNGHPTDDELRQQTIAFLASREEKRRAGEKEIW